MSSPFRARGMLAFALVLAAGCQDYNFNPVGHCLIQPGSRRVTLSNISTADVLFVVDESGSMGGEQAALATNFNAFVNNLNQTNAARAAAGLQPIDFHLAVTTTSVFWNFQTTNTCKADCGGAAGTVCCTAGNVPVRNPKPCVLGGPAGQCPGTTQCRLDCAAHKGDPYCCAASGAIPPEALTELVPCDPGRAGTMCGTLETHYDFQGCSAPIAIDDWRYPRGDFVSRNFATTPNPRVIHFDKELYPTPPNPSATNRQGFTASELITFFQQNVQVGTCGSGQEQALQAGRLALQKAFAGQQRDTYGETRTSVWTPPTGTQHPTTVAARWPNPNSKLLVVFVGDEDDCSSPEDPAGGVVMLAESPGGAAGDACQRDGRETTDAAIRNKQLAVNEFVEYFTSLGRPIAAGFILPAAQSTCSIDSCTTDGLCCHPTLGCDSVNGAQARGVRLLATAQELRSRGVEVVAGSICDPDFGDLLNQMAEIAKPPTGLELPSRPAEEDVTLLRIADAAGQTRKVCGRPLAPGAYATVPDAQATGADWWFTADKNPGVPVAVSQFVYINPRGSCIANPGETYSADYLGRVPAGGCWDDAGAGSGDDMCRRMLGGEAGSWTCYAPGAGNVCGATTQASPGTCLCGGRIKNCPNG